MTHDTSYEPPNITEIPKAELVDHIQFGNQVLASAVFAGYLGPALKICEWFMAGPLQKRRDCWIQAIALRLVVMERYVKDFRWQRLQDKEEFVTIAAQASQIAMRTHQQEKLEALRSAVTNSAIGSGNDFGVESMFLQFIDRFTVEHITWLKHYHNYQKGRKPPGSADLENMIANGKHPEWRAGHSACEELRKIIVTDLNNSGLLKDLEPIDRLEAGWYNAVTDLGERFLEYISSEDFEGMVEGKPPKPKEKTIVEMMAEQGANAQAVFRSNKPREIQGQVVAKQVRYGSPSGRQFQITVLQQHNRFSFEVDELLEGELLAYGPEITSGHPPAYNMKSRGTKRFWVETGISGGTEKSIEEAIEIAIILLRA